MARLAEAEKLHRDGTHRTVAPTRTHERLLPVLERIGVTRVAVITGLDVVGIPVVMVCRPNGRSLSVSQGKGADLVSAKVSGIMEALEAWHAERILLPLRLATYRELREVARVVDVEQLPRPSWSRFHSDLSILWIEGTDVIGGERVWVPYECVHLDFRSPGPHGSGCFLANGTGLAAGNHLLEAVSHALCEAVERDAFALWDERSGADRAACLDARHASPLPVEPDRELRAVGGDGEREGARPDCGQRQPLDRTALEGRQRTVDRGGALRELGPGRQLPEGAAGHRCAGRRSSRRTRGGRCRS